MADLVVGLIVLAAALLVVRKIRKDKQNGRGCSGCSGCSKDCSSRV